MIRILSSIAAATLAAGVASAHAARPMVTDDARIVDAGACQLETWLRRNPDTTEAWSLPACNPMGNLEITAGGARTSGGGDSGLTDKVVQAKTLLKPLEESWGVGLAVGTDVHPRRDGSRRWPGSPYVYVPFSVKAAGDDWIVHVNAGATRDRDARRTIGTWGMGHEIRLDERLYAIAETFANDRSRPFYQAGLRYWIAKDRLQLDATYGDRLEARSGERWFTVGLRFLGPRFLP
jgi:hypothetical protein